MSISSAGSGPGLASSARSRLTTVVARRVRVRVVAVGDDEHRVGVGGVRQLAAAPAAHRDHGDRRHRHARATRPRAPRRWWRRPGRTGPTPSAGRSSSPSRSAIASRSSSLRRDARIAAIAAVGRRRAAGRPCASRPASPRPDADAAPPGRRAGRRSAAPAAAGRPRSGEDARIRARCSAIASPSRSARRYHGVLPSASDTCRNASSPWSGLGPAVNQVSMAGSSWRWISACRVMPVAERLDVPQRRLRVAVAERPQPGLGRLRRQPHLRGRDPRHRLQQRRVEQPLVQRAARGGWWRATGASAPRSRRRPDAAGQPALVHLVRRASGGCGAAGTAGCGAPAAAAGGRRCRGRSRRARPT